MLEPPANGSGTSGSPTPSEQQYSLRWNDFHSSILSSFRRLRDEEDFVDVTLACEGCSFTAHKVVLSACSPYFRRLLKANPCEHPIVILRDVRGEDMESLLRFMYHGEVHIGHEQLPDFLKTAQLLQVRGLADVPSAGMSGGLANMVPTSMSTPLPITPITELKTSPQSASVPLPWELKKEERPERNESRDETSLSITKPQRPPPPTSASSTSSQRVHQSRSLGTPPPGKRARSSDLYRAQMRAAGLSPDRVVRRLVENGLDMRESLLGQVLEGGPTLHVNNQNKSARSESSLQHQGSTGEDSNSSDTEEPSDNGNRDDRDDRDYDSRLQANGASLLGDRGGSGSFPGALLGLQGLQGLLPGPSGLHGAGDNFDILRVRATDPRPCPKCGKIYRSAHTLRTHLEDKHTVCPGYRCVLCGTVAKSRNSLHSHMSRQHRGISTKDLPVLPMPSPFDPELASRLLAKAGVKISAAELRARASPTGPRRSDVKLEIRGQDSDAGGSMCGDNDPEDLTVVNQGMTPHRYMHDLSSPGGFNHQPNNTTITKVNMSRGPHSGLTPKTMDGMYKDPYGTHAGPPGATATGSAILDTYLQFITENSFGMGMTQEQAAAAMHAAKMAQLSAMGLDKLPHNSPYDYKSEFEHKAMLEAKHSSQNDIRRDEPMDLGMENTRENQNNSQDNMESSDDEANYSDDDARDDRD